MNNESPVDRILRETREESELREVQVDEGQRFVEGAIDHAIASVETPLRDGVKLAVGSVHPTQAKKMPKAKDRAIQVIGDSEGGIHVELLAIINGIPEVVDNPRDVKFNLSIDGEITLPNSRGPISFAVKQAPELGLIPSAQFVADTIVARIREVVRNRQDR